MQKVFSFQKTQSFITSWAQYTGGQQNNLRFPIQQAKARYKNENRSDQNSSHKNYWYAITGRDKLTQKDGKTETIYSRGGETIRHRCNTLGKDR